MSGSLLLSSGELEPAPIFRPATLTTFFASLAQSGRVYSAPAAGHQVAAMRIQARCGGEGENLHLAAADRRNPVRGVAGGLRGSAHRQTGDVTPLFHDALFKPPVEPIDGRAIFAVDAPMRRFLAEEIVPQTRHTDPQQALLDAMNGKLLIDHDSEMTRTASQTFAAREGNCLSLVIMAAALAKQLDVRVTYQEVYDFDTWSRTAGFAILSQHVKLVLGPRGPSMRVYEDNATPMTVDFLPPREVAAPVPAGIGANRRGDVHEQPCGRGDGRRRHQSRLLVRARGARGRPGIRECRQYARPHLP